MKKSTLLLVGRSSALVALAVVAIALLSVRPVRTQSHPGGGNYVGITPWFGAQSSVCQLGASCYPNTMVDLNNFQTGANECADLALAAASASGPPTGLTWIDARAFTGTYNCGSTNLYLPHTHILFGCSTWQTDIGFNLGPAETFEAPPGGDSNCLKFQDNSSFPGSGAVTVATGSSGASSLTVNKAGSGEAQNVMPFDLLQIAGDTTSTPFGTGVYEVVGDTTNNGHGIALASPASAVQISVIPNLGQNETGGNTVTVVHPVIEASGAGNVNCTGSTACAGVTPGIVIHGVTIVCSTSHPQIGLRNQYAQDNSRFDDISTSNCGPRDGQIVNQAPDSTYGPIYSTHASSSTYMNSATYVGVGWQIAGQGANIFTRITEVCNSCTTNPPLIGIELDSNTTGTPNTGSGPHFAMAGHVEGFANGYGAGYFSQAANLVVKGATGCPAGTGSYPNGFKCQYSFRIFNATSSGGSLGSNSTGPVSIENFFCNTGNNTACLQDDITGNTLTATNNSQIPFYVTDAGQGAFGLINPADTGLTGIFPYGNILNGYSSGTQGWNITKAGVGTFIGSLNTGTSPPTGITVGTGAMWAGVEGANATGMSAGQAVLVMNSTTHELAYSSNGSTSYGLLVRAQPSPVDNTGLTAAVSATTLCAASSGACNVAGQYHIHINVWGSGTACSSPAGGVTPSLTWTDENGTSHSGVIIPMFSQTTATAVSVTTSAPTVPFESALANESGSGDYNLSSNGSVINYAVAYTACTTGTGTYNIRATATRLQ